VRVRIRLAFFISPAHQYRSARAVLILTLVRIIKFMDQQNSPNIINPQIPNNQEDGGTKNDDTTVPLEIKPAKSGRKKWLALGVLVILLVGIGGYVLGKAGNKNTAKPLKSASITTAANPQPELQSQGIKLDLKKNYGNKYSNGLLPVGDNKYVTDAPKAGYIYVCSQYSQNLKADQGGAGSRGPWFVNNNTQYDINKKLHVQGNINWTSSFNNKVSGAVRTISTNDLPIHYTGVFPISSKDPAYTYDRNPNSIKSQTLTYSLSASPTYGSPNCAGGQVGVMLTGVALFNAFDAGGRDAGAWEIQDGCSGHPEKTGEYHYHTLSTCIKDISVSSVIGFALDGFPITGPQVSANNIVTTSDLDACHGLTSEVMLDGKKVTTYHYVMTQDFPYSISCFRSKAANPPGLQQQSQQPTQQAVPAAPRPTPAPLPGTPRGVRPIPPPMP
jgi:hypothetical protein